MGRSLTPLGALARGAVAGAVGTVAMDAVRYVRYRRGGGEASPLQWEFGLSVDKWEDAPAPAQLGRRLIEAFTQRSPSVDKAALVNDAMHWSYGVAWGALFGAVAGSLRRRNPLLITALGLPCGAVVWGASYVVLPVAGLYQPIWTYDIPVLAQDLGAHLVYGVATAAAFAALAPA